MTDRVSTSPCRPFAASGFLVLRSPLLPLQQYFDWLTVPASEIAERRDQVAHRLLTAAEDPIVREALFIASPVFEEQLSRLVNDPQHPKRRKTEGALLRFLTRAAFRATPFGTFAGVSLGSIGKTTNLQLLPREAAHRHARLDMLYLTQLTDRLALDPQVHPLLPLAPNPTLHRIGGRYYYVETKTTARDRHYQLAVVEATPYVEVLLATAAEGATIARLHQALQTFDAELSLVEIEPFVAEVIDSQLLSADFGAPITGTEPLEQVLSQLRDRGAPPFLAEQLEEVARRLQRLSSPPGVTERNARISRFRDVIEGLEALPAPIDRERLFQIDLHKPAARLELGDLVVAEMTRAIELAWRLAPRNPDRWRAFRDAFAARYDGPTPLLELLDEEHGIGFETREGAGTEPSELLEDVPFANSGADETVRWSARERVLLRWLVEAAATATTVLRLSPADIESIAEPRPLPLPDAFAALFRLSALDPSSIDAGDFEFSVEFVSGPAGANLLGRFCQANATLSAAVREHLRAEEQHHPDALYAEIVHLPEGRIGNVLLRPTLRTWDLPFLGRSGLPPTQQLTLSDLLVDVRDQRVVLWSRRLGREVMPRLTNAHNVDYKGLAVYRFLSALKEQSHQHAIYFDWGALNAAPFLPRVQVGRAVLSKARWRIEGQALRSLLDADPQARARAYQLWRERSKAPRHLVLKESDNELLCDLDDPLTQEMLTSELADRSSVEWVEPFPPLDACPVLSPEGRFTNELIIPFVCTDSGAANMSVSGPIECSTRALHLPGSEWAQLNLFAGPATIDRLLREEIPEWIERLKANAIVREWFFVRYTEPGWHLRLRLNGDRSAIAEAVADWLQGCAQPLVDDGSVSKLNLDSYQPEQRRYGGPAALSLCEKIFTVDSDVVTALLRGTHQLDGAPPRWALAATCIDRLLTAFDFSLAAKESTLVALADSFAAEQGGKSIRPALERKHRSLSSTLHMVLRGEGLPELVSTELQSYERRLRPLTSQLLQLERAQALTNSSQAIASSLIHMHVNRMLRAAHRAQEAVLYFMLWREYRSEIGRQDRSS
jgi:thiopeptide-type bacteriocin biosynthesis protein